MKIKFNFNVKIFLLIFLLIIPFLCPNYFINNFNTISKAVYITKYVFALFLMVLCILNYKSLNKTILLLFLFYIIQFLSCIINDIPIIQFLNSVINIIGPLLIMFIFGRKYIYELILAFVVFYEIVIYINLGSILICPNEGLYTIKTYITPRLVEIYDYWFLGIDNSHILYFFPGLLFSLVYSFFKKNKIILRTKILFGAILISALIRWSATTIMFCVLALIFVLGYRILSNNKIFNIKKYLFIGTSLNIGIVIFKLQNYFKYIIVDILKKDLTFTNRVYIWEDTLYFIKQKFLIGYGYESELTRYLKGIQFNAFTAHNTFLEIVYQSGIIPLIVIVLMLISMSKNLNKIDNGNIVAVLSYFIFIVFVISLTEAYGLNLLFPVILLSWILANNQYKPINVNY